MSTMHSIQNVWSRMHSKQNYISVRIFFGKFISLSVNFDNFTNTIDLKQAFQLCPVTSLVR